MPVLKNSRHELFAQNLAKGLTQDQSYLEAGYKPNRRNAARLLKTNEDIRNRVAELQTRNVQKQDEMAKITTERLLVMAEEARTKAMSERGGSAAAIAAITAIAKLSGKWIEKSETTTRTDDLNQLSDAELAAIVRQGQPEPGPLNPEAKKLN
jgi:phage terminase small subunit